MKKEDILQLAKNEKDEREETITIHAYKVAGNISIFFASCLALLVIIDGYLLTSGRTYDCLTVAAMLFATVSVNMVIFALYQVIKLNNYKEIVDIAVFGTLFIWAAKIIVCFYIP